MIDFGYTLQKARHDRGMTIAQIAETTRMLPQQVEDLENENFSRIAAPIYGRGFVKLYCEAVGIDSAPLVAEFMDIYNGNREPTIRMRKNLAPQPEPSPQHHVPAPQQSASVAQYVQPQPEQYAPLQPEPQPQQYAQPTETQQYAQPAEPQQYTQPAEPAPEQQEEDSSDTFFDRTEREDEYENTIDYNGEDTAATVAYTGRLDDFKLETETVRRFDYEPREEEVPTAPQRQAAPRAPSRYAAPVPLDDRSEYKTSQGIPPTVWRFGLLAVVATLILWGAVSMIRKVWDAATIPPENQENDGIVEVSSHAQPETTNAPAPAKVKPPAPVAPKQGDAPKEPRKPLSIPPLYID